jgi:type I restriction enzyme, S subunit
MSWKICKISDIFDVARGGSPRPIQNYLTDSPEGLNWIMIGDTVDGSKYITSTKKRIKPEGLTKTRMVREGDFLLTNSMSFGRPYILKISGCIHDGWLVLSPKVNEVFPDFFFYLLGSDTLYQEFAKRAAGAVVKNLNTTLVKHIQIPLPPLAEQKRIAAILDAADTLRAKRREAIAQLDSFLQSTFVDMFGDPATNPKFSIINLGKHLSFMTTGGRGWARYYRDHGARFIRSLDVQMNRISDIECIYVDPPNNVEAERTRVSKNDVLLTMTGSRIGRAAKVPDSLEGSFISQHVAIIRLRETLHPEFLARFLTLENGGQAQIRKLQYGQTKPGLGFQQVKAFLIPVPPLPLQHQFATIVESVEQQKARMQAHLAELDALFASLQARAFNGEL